MPARVVITRSNPIAPDPRVEREAAMLASAGYAVSALAWDRSDALPEDETSDGLHIHRVRIKGEYGSGLRNLGPLTKWQAGLYSELFRRAQDYDIIHACDFDTVIPALCMKKLNGKKVVYDIFDFYADSVRGAPDWVKECIRWVDHHVIDAVDGLVIPDEVRASQLGERHSLRRAVVYNTPPDSAAGLAPSYHPVPGRLRLAFVGVLQVERGLLDVIDVVAGHPEYSLDLAGFGGDEQAIVSHAAAVPNVTFLGRVDYANALKISAAADVLFALYDPRVPNHRYSSPNKLYEAMMLGKPFLAARGTSIDSIVEEFSMGLVVEYGDKDALERALDTLLHDADLRTKLGANARKAYEQRYSFDSSRSNLLGLYQSL
jgi:glycosyltransferase involved in cell wall biosynthesis